MSENSVKSPEL